MSVTNLVRGTVSRVTFEFGAVEINTLTADLVDIASIIAIAIAEPALWRALTLAIKDLTSATALRLRLRGRAVSPIKLKHAAC